jgi:hypothetical protein
MGMTFQGTDIPTGADVFGADGEKVGSVAAAYPGYIVVEKGIFFPTDYYIPLNAVSSYDGGQVYLTVAKDAALHSGWDSQPIDLESAAIAPGGAARGRNPHPGHGGRTDSHGSAPGSRCGPS